MGSGVGEGLLPRKPPSPIGSRPSQEQETWARHPYSSTGSGTVLQAIFEAVAQQGAGKPRGTQEQALAPQAVVPVPQLLPTLARGGLGPPPGTQAGLLRKQGCCRAHGHHESPISLLSQAIKKRKGATARGASRTQGAIRPRAPLPGGVLWHVSNHLIEINCDFPGDSCQQQQAERCMLSPAQWQGRSPHARVQPRGTAPVTCNASASPKSFPLQGTLSPHYSSSKEDYQNHIPQILQCSLTRGSQLLAANPSRSRDCSHKTRKR